MTFLDAVNEVIEREGGYVNHPADKGGETAYGISKRSYPDLDIPTLTKDDARAIYKRDYWDKCRCDELPHGVDLLVFDTAVNMGVMVAGKLLQQALNVPDDGIIGAITIRASINKPDVLEEFLALRMYQYALNPQIHFFGKGWYRRLAKVASMAIKESK